MYSLGPISERFVEKTWKEVAGFTSGRPDKEMDKMNKSRHELLTFFMSNTEDLYQKKYMAFDTLSDTKQKIIYYWLSVQII